MKQLKPEYEELQRQFHRKYGLDGNCSCHLSPPCGSCTHEGNPLNLAGTEDAWEEVPDDVPSDAARAANYLEVSRKFQTGELRPLVPQPKEVIEMPESANPLSPLTSGGEASNPPAAAQSLTPRTDAVLRELQGMVPDAMTRRFLEDSVMCRHARDLERKLNSALSELETLKSQLK